MLAQEDHRLRPRQHPHVRRQPELERELADDPVAERVERGDGAVRVAVRHQLVDAELHLVRGLVGERQGQDLGRFRAPRGDQPGDPTGDDLGLAGPGPGDDEEGPLAVGDGAALLQVEPAQERLEAGQVDRRGRHRRGPELPLRPDGQLVERRWLLAAPWPPHRPDLDIPFQRHAERISQGCDSLGVTPSAAPAAPLREARS